MKGELNNVSDHSHSAIEGHIDWHDAAGGKSALPISQQPHLIIFS